MKKIIYIIIGVGLCTAMLSCAKGHEEEMLEFALEVAGNNRGELEKVMEHYEDDSLKLKTAKFLIRNMPGHCSYAPEDSGVVKAYANAVDSVLRAMKGETDYNIIRDSIDSMACRMGMDSLRKVQDCCIVKAEFIIANIDSAFQDWKHGPWARHIGFEDFCEWILPYKVEELQPLDDWRERLKSYHTEKMEGLKSCDQLRNSPLAAAKILNRNLADSLRPVTGLSVRFANIPLEQRAHIPFGQCGDYANMAATIMRSHGIPVVVEFTPQWAKRSLGHAWNVLKASDGKEIAFGGICDKLGELHKPHERMPKVYRYTYAHNREMMELNKEGGYIPALFRNVFMKDVTAERILCRDVTLETKGIKEKTIYLTVFNNKEWVPVAFGWNRKGRVTFKDMGVDVMYLPVTFGNGTMKAAGEPFILEYDGGTKRIMADTLRKTDMRLERKYPVMEYGYEYIPRLTGGEFQASERPDFETYHVVHRIPEGKRAGQYIQVPDSVPPYRYWRYTSKKKHSFCSIAEVMFYAEGDTVKMEGKVIGTDGAWAGNRERTKEKVFDGDILTAFDAPRGEGCWTGVDFGYPVKMDHIIYYGRGDGNAVEMGDEYEFFYWNEGRWKSLGKKKANMPWLIYEEVPMDGLYLLRDLTKGVDERIFTYEEGKQVFW